MRSPTAQLEVIASHRPPQWPGTPLQWEERVAAACWSAARLQRLVHAHAPRAAFTGPRALLRVATGGDTGGGGGGALDGLGLGGDAALEGGHVRDLMAGWSNHALGSLAPLLLPWPLLRCRSADVPQRLARWLGESSTAPLGLAGAPTTLPAGLQAPAPPTSAAQQALVSTPVALNQHVMQVLPRAPRALPLSPTSASGGGGAAAPLMTQLPVWVVHDETGLVTEGVLPLLGQLLQAPALGLQLGPAALHGLSGGGGGTSSASTTLDLVLDQHASTVRALQPVGPYVLVGAGPVGCLVAHALACRLEDAPGPSLPAPGAAGVGSRGGGGSGGGVSLVLVDGSPAAALPGGLSSLPSQLHPHDVRHLALYNLACGSGGGSGEAPPPLDTFVARLEVQQLQQQRAARHVGAGPPEGAVASTAARAGEG